MLTQNAWVKFFNTDLCNNSKLTCMKCIQKITAIVAVMLITFSVMAQVTTSSINGRVKNKSDKGLGGATVVAVHEPTGSTYRTLTQDDGSFTIPALRVGGPYKLSISFVGYREQVFNEIYLQLGVPAKINPAMESNDAMIETVLVTGKAKNKLIGADKNGTGTNIGRRTLETLPTLSRNLSDFTKLTPQSNGLSFGGQDNRLNNITIDGSSFNNSFGLQSLLGSQTNSTPISLDAIEEVQINLSPYNVREGGFTGAGVNAVTRSGTNTFHGSAFYNQRNEGYVGTSAGKNKVTTTAFDVKQFGFRFGGPIIKNKLFFFVNGEGERRNDPGTNFRANNGGEASVGNVSRVLKSELDNISKFLKDTLGYNTGAYQDYSLQTFSNKALAKIDWNINDHHRFSFRFNYLRSYRDVPVSNSGGFNGRRDNAFAMAFQNSNYKINNDLYSAIAELNSTFSNKISNNLIFGYTAQRDYRSSESSIFPTVDILDGAGGRNYMTFGTEPFTPNNKLNTDTWQFQDNVSLYRKKHTYTAGVQFEALKFINGFTPTVYGQYVFRTLNDFYTAARAFKANPNLTTSPVTMERYVLSYSALPGRGVWEATTKAYQASAYLQDDWQVDDKFRLTYGVRLDIPFFGNTGYQNDSVSAYKFQNEFGQPLSLSTSKLPGAKLLFSPRIGFNWDVNGNKQTQIRGGAGIFTGKPPFVFISNQIGNNGVQSGQINTNGTAAFPFNTDVTKWIPTTISVPAPSYNIAVTDPDFKYPQTLRGNIAVDQQLPWNVVLTAEIMATRGLNDIGYIQANLKSASRPMPGPDNRPLYPGFGLSGTPQNNALRTNTRITDATVLKNINGSNSVSYSVKLERPFQRNWSAMVAYNYGRAFDYISAGSIAFSSWSQNVSLRGNNQLDLTYSNNDLTHRLISNFSYRQELFNKKASLQLNLFSESRTQGRSSFVYSGDANGDGISANDLLFVPKDFTQMNFEAFTETVNGVTTIYTVASQVTAFNAFIDQDKYLSKLRGGYAERNGLLQPWLTRFDASAILDVTIKAGKTKHSVQFRADIFNIGNLFNKNAGVSDIVNNTAPVRAMSRFDANGIPVYRFNSLNGSLNYSTFRKGSFISDVWQAQFGIRYTL